MELVVVVNALAELDPTQTTSLLLHGAAARGWRTWVADLDGLALDPDDRARAAVRRVTTGATVRDTLAATRHAGRDRVSLHDVDVVLVRTNPARAGLPPVAHAAALQLLAWAADRGVVVLNRPHTLLRATTKLYLAELPASVRPRTLVTRDPEALVAFVRSEPGPCVLKPLQGTHGRDVFFVEGAGPRDNLRQILDVLLREGVVMAQAFVPEATGGDLRLLLVDGEPLRVGERVAAVRRVPAEGELRSNVAQGGTTAPPGDLDAALAVAAAVGPILRRDGLFLAGLDLVGNRVVEVNVFSPGGLPDASAWAGADLVETVLDALVERVGETSWLQRS